jgi:hypothetical protein
MSTWGLQTWNTKGEKAEREQKVKFVMQEPATAREYNIEWWK